MAIYILLSRLSQQGVATLKSNPDRLREVNHDVDPDELFASGKAWGVTVRRVTAAA